MARGGLGLGLVARGGLGLGLVARGGLGLGLGDLGPFIILDPKFPGPKLYF